VQRDHFPYAEADRTLLRRAAEDAALLEDRNARPGPFELAFSRSESF